MRFDVFSSEKQVQEEEWHTVENVGDFLNELVHWIRFSKNEAENKKDGIWSATMGMPTVCHTLIEEVLMRFSNDYNLKT